MSAESKCEACGSAWCVISDCGAPMPVIPDDWDLPPAAKFRAIVTQDRLRDALLVHHPVMRSETGPFSGCRCGGVQLGEDVIAHVVTELVAGMAAE